MVNHAPVLSAPRPRNRIRLGREEILLRLCLLGLALFLAVGLLLPVYTLLAKGLQNANGDFVGLQNFVSYFAEPGVSVVFWNSLRISLVSTTLTLVLAGAIITLTKHMAGNTLVLLSNEARHEPSVQPDLPRRSQGPQMA